MKIKQLKKILLKVIPLYPYLWCQKKLLSRLEEVIPQHTYLILQYELSVALMKYKKTNLSRQYDTAKDLLVNIGAGGQGKPGWINVDIFEASGINCVYDCRKSLPFPDNSAKGIFSEHFFEHIDYVEEVPYFLAECYRVLKPGGIIRLIVPDLQKYLKAYCEEGWEELSRIRPLDLERKDFYYNCKYNTKMELINFVFRQNYEHKYAYDYATIEFLLYKYGFSTVKLQDFSNSLMDELCIDNPIRASESLYVEAVK